MAMNRGFGRTPKPTKKQQQKINRNTPKTDQGKGAKSDPNKTKKPKPITPPKTSGFGWGGGFGKGGFGGTNGPGVKPPKTEVPDDAPPMPDTPLPEGWYWDWDESLKQWVPMQGEAEEEEEEDAEEAEKKRKRQNDLFTEYSNALEQFGLKGQGVQDFLREAVAEDWNDSTFIIKLRQQDFYLANPLFKANIANAKAGNDFMTEGEVISFATNARRLAKQYGYKEPSDSYIAMGLGGGLSLAEFEHRFRVQDRINQFGAGVGLVYKELMGVDPTDQDLYEIFDNEISTKDFDDKARRAEMRGRPFTLGLGIRTEAEARALEMLGINPDEAFKRYESVAANATRMERLGSIEAMIAGGLPADFGSQFGTTDNSLLIRGLVFQDQAALAELQNLTAKEIARFRSGGGAQSASGQAIGLLSGAERATFG